MASQTIPGGLLIPAFFPALGSTAATYFGTTSQRIDATGERFAWIIQIPKTGTLDKVEFRLGAVTFNAASVLRISFQDLDGSGNPDGTQDQFRDMTTLTANGWNVPGLITSTGADGGVKRSVTKGDYMAIVGQYQTFTAADTIDAGNVSILSNTDLPYGGLFIASWAKITDSLPGIALKYSDSTYETETIQAVPWSAANVATFNSGSTPDERGLVFQMPVPCTLDTAIMRIDADNAYDIVLYDAADGVLETITGSSVNRGGTAGRNRIVKFSGHNLTKNVNYRLVVKPGASNISTYDADFASATIMQTVYPSTWQHTERTNAGAWTDTSTKIPLLALRFTKFDDGVGGGGGLGDRIISASGGSIIRAA